MQDYLQFLAEYAPRLIDGTIVTAQQTLLAAILAIVIALIMALMKMSSVRALRWFAVGYIELFRGTSLLVQLFWIFFVLPFFGVTLEPFTAGFIAVGMNLGAYGAELVRGGIQSVPRGQYEACIALNLPPVSRFRRVIFPQALLKMLPPWGNLLIELLKATALVVYYLMARLLITPSMRYLEHRMSRKLSRG